MHRIGYLGWVGHHNLGDEALFIAFQKLFQRALVLPYKLNDKFKKFEKVCPIPLFKSVCLGGGTLINFNELAPEFEYIQGKYASSFVFGSGVRNPSFWATRGKHKDSIQDWVRILRRCEFVGVRGPLSYGLLKDNGLDNVKIIGDLALSLASGSVKPKSMNKRVGINIGISNGHVWGTEEEILEKVVSLGDALLDDGWGITFLPVWARDLPYIKRAAERMKKKVDILQDFLSLEKTMRFLESCDVFVGEKLHSVILAMAAYTPAIMLEYRPKCLDFMLSMEMPEFNFKTDAIKVRDILEKVHGLYSNIPYYQDKIAEKINYYASLQRSAAEALMAS